VPGRGPPPPAARQVSPPGAGPPRGPAMTPARRHPCRPRLEVLEDRDLPADLMGLAFDVVTGPVSWGGRVQAEYTLVNRDLAAAGAFDVQVRLSPDTAFTAADPLVATFHVNGLAARGLTSGLVTIDLPAAPPPGFGPSFGGYLGLVLDPDNRVAETDE